MANCNMHKKYMRHDRDATASPSHYDPAIRYMMPAQALVADPPHTFPLKHLFMYSTELLDFHVHVFKNMLLMFHSLLCSLTVPLALLYYSYAGVPLQQYRACAGMSFEWKFISH